MFGTTAGQQRQQQQQPEQHYNILLVGETGAGKSTLINYLTNYFLDGSPENMKIAIPTKHHRATEDWQSSEEDVQDTSKSQTSKCHVYDFTSGAVRYNFIDTPGLSSTGKEGPERDDKHIENIMSTAEKVGTLSAIIVLINGTVSRETANVKNALTRLRGSVPDVVMSNLVFILTNCSETTCNFNPDDTLRPWRVHEKNLFHMNNSVLSKPMVEWKRDAKRKGQANLSWQESMNEIKKMIERIHQLSHVATDAFGNMLKHRNQIKAEIHGILVEVKKLQDVQDQLACAKAAQSDVCADIEKYSNFKRTKQLEYVEIEQTPYKNTVCQHCDTVCHESCGLEFIEEKGNANFKRCACMAGGPKCTICKCDHTTHYHAMGRPVKRTKTIEEILNDVKALHDNSTKKQGELDKKINSLDADLANVQNVLDKKADKIDQCCRDLKKLCKHFNIVAELHSVIETLEQNAKTLTSMSTVEKCTEMIKNIKQVADELSKSQ